jgi:Copper(I)-binding protein CorA
MKLNRKMIKAMILTALSFTLSAADAATKLSNIVAFTPGSPKSDFKIKSTSWRDSNYGNLGVVSGSNWGAFSVSKGRIVKITASTVKGMHPGITVWYRGESDTAPEKDTAPNNYVADKQYPQNATISADHAKYGTKDIGNIFMEFVAQGYDNDGMDNYGTDVNGKKITRPPAGITGFKDDKNGVVTLRFQAPKDGNYQFVVGGFNPATNIVKNKSYSTTVSIIANKPKK